MVSIALHVSIHPRATNAGPGHVPPMFDRTFEEVTDALTRLPRMYVEPDGSFVWVASAEPAWQLDGMLYDGAGRLWYVELKGRCPQEEFDRLLSTFGWPQTPLVIQLVREAVRLEEPAFRRYAGWATT